MSFSSTNKFQTNFLCSKSHEKYLVLLNSISQSWNCQTDFCCVVMLNMLRLKCFNLRLWFKDKFEIWLIELKHKSMLLGQYYELKRKTSTDRNFLTGRFLSPCFKSVFIIWILSQIHSLRKHHEKNCLIDWKELQYQYQFLISSILICS